MKKSKKIAISAIMASLGVVFLYVGSLLEVLDLSSACVASICVLFCLTELGIPSAIGVYAVITTLGFLILPQKLPAFFFTFFFGIMPVTKMLFEKLGTRIGKVLCLIFKIVLFNGELFVFAFLAKKLLEIPESTALKIVYIVLSNLIFILLDILYGLLVRIYYGKIRQRISKFLK